MKISIEDVRRRMAQVQIEIQHWQRELSMLRSEQPWDDDDFDDWQDCLDRVFQWLNELEVEHAELATILDAENKRA